MLLFRKRGIDVVGEMLQMQLGYSCEHSGKDAHDTIMLNMRVGPGPRPAMLPGAMTGGEMQALLQCAGQYVLDDLASDIDDEQTRERTCRPLTIASSLANSYNGYTNTRRI